MKVALVCDWLTNVGGAEKVLLQIHKMYPEAPIYTSQYNPRKIDWFSDAEVRVSWMRFLPCGLRRFLGPVRARYFAKLDLSQYDLVISVTGAEAKAVKTFDARTGRKAVHVSYCHVPTQYYWQMYDEYVKNPGFGVLNPVVRFCFKALVKPLRRRDYEAAQGVDQFVTISEYAKGLIRKYYKREAVVVWPPVEIENFDRKLVKSQMKQGNKSDFCQAGGCGKLVENFYAVTSRQVTWKRLDLAVKACVKYKRPLVVVGEGPEHKKLVALAGGSPLIQFLPLATKEELAVILSSARGYIFPSMEPFGIAPVEALAAGCPVIAYGVGGALDYVKDGENGVLFEKQTVDSLARGMEKFEKMKFDAEKVSKSVEKFSGDRFEKELRRVISEATD
ncbi:glycosyltransferase [Candidatus Saccharibacteria bacterium]|nr:glycosyltransferase [Candidatus Saccharibacteria bacterium]MBQ6375700.1 glycosyltransferase [Candidatus Saccharibacteria bacterium]